jgi:hypothetical protein
LEDGMGVGHKQKCDILIENYGASNILSSFWLWRIPDYKITFIGRLSVVLCAYNPSTGEAEEEGSQVWGQLRLHIKTLSQKIK